MKGVIDRIEEKTAVILIAENEKTEILWPIDYLPEDAEEGSILDIKADVNHEKTKKQKKKIKNLIDKLRNKNN